jgi:hypothetical protein
MANPLSSWSLKQKTVSYMIRIGNGLFSEQQKVAAINPHK